MLTRVEMEHREDQLLAPFAMRSAASRGRVHPEEEHPYRTAYQRDRERVIHSTAFRRLEYKTQVFVNHEGDHYRTRLTHTMEVAQIARAIARALNLNEDLTEAVALAHDLGHTPFGHSGEDALRELMKDHGGFEHNTHGLRVVDRIEQRYPRFRGLNLTWEVREAIAKHSSYYDHPAVKSFDPEKRPVLEGQIVDASDSIAYVAHDLDDAFTAHILTDTLYDDVPWIGAFRDTARRAFPALSERQERTEVVRALINLLVTDLCAHTTERLEALRIATPEDVRRAPEPVVSFSASVREKKDALQRHLFDHVYRYYRVMRMARKARRFIEELFCAYIEDPRQLPPDYQEWCRQEGLHQGVCDYIAGMTDRYAQDEHLRLFAPFERV